jgi:hypothetical protein
MGRLAYHLTTYNDAFKTDVVNAKMRWMEMKRD